MLDLQKHKEYLWKYLLTYGKARKKREDYRQLVFPFQDIVIEEGKTVEDYRREALKQQLEACSSIEEIFDMISLEYKGISRKFGDVAKGDLTVTVSAKGHDEF